jgi:very-short-patch-repair endonuclease
MKETNNDAKLPALTRDRARVLRAVQTEVERRLWQRLRNRQLNGTKFRRQDSIAAFIVDFLCLEARLVIELDGSQHGEDAERRADQRRTELITREGYAVLCFWNEEVLDNIDGVLESIGRHL